MTEADGGSIAIVLHAACKGGVVLYKRIIGAGHHLKLTGWRPLLNEPGVQEVCVGADKSGADKARGAPQRGDRQEMDQAGTEDDIGARLE